jgi:Lar family restriction alleviation protein
MTPVTDLLPCPFCGGTDIDARFALANDGKVGTGCMDCGACAECHDTEAKAIKAWNTRAALARSPAPAAAPQAAGEGVSEAEIREWIESFEQLSDTDGSDTYVMPVFDRAVELMRKGLRATPARETPAAKPLSTDPRLARLRNTIEGAFHFPASCEALGALDALIAFACTPAGPQSARETPAARREAVEEAVQRLQCAAVYYGGDQSGDDSRSYEGMAKARAALLALLRPAAGDGGAAVWEKALAIASKCCDEACYEGDETAWLHEVVARLQAASRGEPAGGEAGDG